MRSVRTKIRISEGKRKLACSLPSESIFGAAKDTNKPRAKASLLAFFPRRSILGAAKVTNKPSAKAARLRFAETQYLGHSRRRCGLFPAKKRGAVAGAWCLSGADAACGGTHSCGPPRPEAAARAAPPEPHSVRYDPRSASSKASPALAFALGLGCTLAFAEDRQCLVKSIACVCFCPRLGVYFGFRRRSAVPRQKHRLRLLLPSACTIFARENGEQAPATNTIPI